MTQRSITHVPEFDCRSVGAGLLVVVGLLLGCHHNDPPRATKLGEGCRQDEERCADGAGFCVPWSGKQTCMTSCDARGACPKGTLPVKVYGYECYCEPDLAPDSD